MNEILVLGGSGFVGRAVVEVGLARGAAVTTFNRGRGDVVDRRVVRVIGDRTDARTLAPLAAREWDLVVDTWAWLSALDAPPPMREGSKPPGISHERERAVLDAWRAST